MTDDVAKGNILAELFASVYPAQTSSIRSTAPETENVPRMPKQLTITEQHVSEEISRVNTSKSCGPDGIHPLILRELVMFITPAVTERFRCSLETSDLPQDWKSGVIQPIYKAGERQLPGDYRPVCMTSILVKILERIIRDEIDDHLLEHQLLVAQQHGFVRSKCCVTNLLLAREAWYDAREQRSPVHVTSIDFSKVDHSILVRKLQSMGISWKILEWIKAYLSDRSWRVGIGDCYSSGRYAVSGVPQGSILGPRLFTLSVQDLVTILKSECLLYADDIKIWRVIRSAGDEALLQSDLTALYEWAKHNCLPINVAKSSIMTIGDQSSVVYSVGSTPLEHVESVRDLGVILRSDLKTIEHTNKARKQGLAVLWMLKRASSLWSPSFVP